MDCLDVTVLAFIFELYAVPHLWNILHNIFPAWCWDSQALPTIKHFMIWGFRIKDSLKKHIFVITNLFCEKYGLHFHFVIVYELDSMG